MLKRVIAAVVAACLFAVAQPAYCQYGSALNVEMSPPNASVTATAAAGTGVTLTIPASVNARHYITKVRITKFAAALLTAAATPVNVTTTNLPSTPSFDFQADAAAQGTIQALDMNFDHPLQSSVANTNTTIVCPATTNVIWRVTAFYYLAQ